MALDILVKVLIDSCWKDLKLSDVEISKLEAELEIYFDQLHSVSTNLGWGTWHQRKAEDHIQYGDDDSLEQALVSAREAYAISSREDFQPLIWKILIKLGADTHLVELVKTTSDAIENNRFNARTRSVAARYLIAAHIRHNDIPSAQRVFDRHSSGFPRGVAKNVQASIRSRDIENAIWLE